VNGLNACLQLLGGQRRPGQGIRQQSIQNPDLPIKIGGPVVCGLLLRGKILFLSELWLFSPAPLSLSSLLSLSPLPVRLTPALRHPATLPSAAPSHHLYMTTSNDERQALGNP
jgi:hypothetical protein